MVTYSSTNPAVHGRPGVELEKSNARHVDHKSDALTTAPPRPMQPRGDVTGGRLYSQLLVNFSAWLVGIAFGTGTDPMSLLILFFLSLLG